MIRVALPALLTLIVVVGYVAAGGWNRSGEPDVALTLTERELALPWRGADADRDPGLQLRIEFEPRHDPLDARNWLTQERLQALGFDVSVPPGSPEASDTYTRVPPRIAWVAFEYAGPAWTEIARRRALRDERDVIRPYLEPSRLVPIDANLEFETLRTRHASSHLILRATIGIALHSASDSAPFVYGHIIELVPDRVTVPRDLRAIIDDLRPPPYVEGTPQDQPQIPPRYEADLAVGRLGIPYLRGIRRLAGA